MPKKFEKEFISYCENQNLEVNPNPTINGFTIINGKGTVLRAVSYTHLTLPTSDLV